MSNLTSLVIQKLNKKEIINVLNTFPTKDVLEKFQIDALRAVLRKFRDIQQLEESTQENKSHTEHKHDLESEANSSYESLGNNTITGDASDTSDAKLFDGLSAVHTSPDVNSLSDKNDANMAQDSSERWEFNKDKDTWDDYVERIEFVFIAQGIADDGKKVAHLLTRCGAESYRLIRDLCAPTKLKDMKYDELVKKVSDHLSPKKSENVERSQFRKTIQRQGESVAEFIARLKEKSLHCNFGNELSKNLCEQLAAGLRDQETKIALYSERELTSEKGTQI
ncbi:hypothetical protein QAD02_017987 [Eretmocerus hayati]|uniref:Uncharacterized protein n=1 Tax=Eretmocerus hayati TaxID=131215 RepID=A0ACC2PF36_9HYME|nr:hypothetical protein QAD02_017987 [Eretmocerus hayati]